MTSKMKYLPIAILLVAMLSLPAAIAQVGSWSEVPNSFSCNSLEGYPGNTIRCTGTYRVDTPGSSVIEVCIAPKTEAVGTQSLFSIFAGPTNNAGQCVAGETFCYSQSVSASSLDVGANKILSFNLVVPNPDSTPKWAGKTAWQYGANSAIIKTSVSTCCNAGPCDPTGSYGYNKYQNTFNILQQSQSSTSSANLKIVGVDSLEECLLKESIDIPIGPFYVPIQGCSAAKFSELHEGKAVKLDLRVKNTGVVSGCQFVEGGIYKRDTIQGWYSFKVFSIQQIPNCVDAEKGAEFIQRFKVCLDANQEGVVPFKLVVPAPQNKPNTDFGIHLQAFNTCYADLTNPGAGPGQENVGQTDKKIEQITIYDSLTIISPPETCTDRITNQEETDIDCGGTLCGGCTAGERCNSNADCSGTLSCKVGFGGYTRCQSGDGGNSTICQTGTPGCTPTPPTPPKPTPSKPSAISLTAEEYEKSTDAAIIAAMCEFPTECSSRGNLSINCLGGEDVLLKNTEALKRFETRVAKEGGTGTGCSLLGTVIARTPLSVFSGIAETACISNYAEAKTNQKLLSGTCRAGEESTGFTGITNFFRTVGELLGLTGGAATAVGASIVVGLGLLILNMVFGRKQ